MLILAHRGASNIALENSMNAFRLAISSGCDGIEFDVHFCNGQALIIHDTNLLRTHSVNLDIAVLDEALRAEYQIPTLTQVMALLPSDLIINIEVKSCDDVLFMQEYVSRLVTLGLLGPHVVISSFDINLLMHLQLLNLPVRWGWLTEENQMGLPDENGNFIYDIVGISAEVVTKDYVKIIQQAGKLVWVFTLDKHTQWNNMVELGVDGYFTNVPNDAVTWFNTRS